MSELSVLMAGLIVLLSSLKESTLCRPQYCRTYNIKYIVSVYLSTILHICMYVCIYSSCWRTWYVPDTFWLSGVHWLSMVYYNRVYVGPWCTVPVCMLVLVHGVLYLCVCWTGSSLYNATVCMLVIHGILYLCVLVVHCILYPCIC